MGVRQPRAVGAGVRVWVCAQHCPLGLHALWGLRAAGVVVVPAPAPQHGALASGRCVLWGRRRGDPGCLPPFWGAFRRPLLPGCPPLGGLPGPATRVLWARVCECRGPALSPWLACPVWGCVPRGSWGAVPGGAGLPPLRGASGVRRCPSSCRPSSGTGDRGSATPVSWVPLVWAWGPSNSPTPCDLLMRAVGAAEGRPRGDAVRRCEGRLTSGAPPPPAARRPGGLSGSATHVLWARVCGCGGPALSPWLACPVGTACRRSGRGPSPGGWPATVVRGVWFQGCPSPGRSSSGAGSRGSATPVSRVRLARAWGPSTGATACALAAGVARCEGGGRSSPGGLPCAVVRGV